MKPQTPNFVPHNAWLIGQQRSRDQRKDRYPAGQGHSQKMVPELCRKMLEHLRLPAGSIVIDPFVGVGTTVVEAIGLGLEAVGCDVSEQYAAWAIENIAAANERAGIVHSSSHVEVGDARSLDGVESNSFDGCVTSPPYGDCDPTRDSNGRSLKDRAAENGGIAKVMERSSHAVEQQGFLVKGAMGSMGRYAWSASMFLAMSEINRVLKPGAFALIAVREYWRRKAHLTMVDLPGIVVELGRRAGMVAHDQIYAIDACIDEWGIPRSRGSMHQNRLAKQMQDGRPCPRGVPGVTRVLVFRKKVKKESGDEE